MNRYLIVMFAVVLMTALSAVSVAKAGEDKCIVTTGCDPRITVVLDMDPERNDPDVTFRSVEFGDFVLEDTNSGRSKTFVVKPGRYVVTQDEFVGFSLTSIDCNVGDSDADESVPNERVIFNVELDDDVKCTFNNTMDVTPTTVATATSMPAAASTLAPVATSVPFTGPSAEAIALLELSNALKAQQPATVTQNQSQTVVVEAPIQSVCTVANGCLAPVAPRQVTAIRAPNTGDGGLANSESCTCSGNSCWTYHPHYRAVTHYDEYGEYQTFELWYWHPHRCYLWA